jgi:hypothetical protein
MYILFFIFLVFNRARISFWYPMTKLTLLFSLQLADDGNLDGEYIRLCERVKNAIFAISANVASIQRMVSHLGTPRDTHDMRSKL